MEEKGILYTVIDGFINYLIQKTRIPIRQPPLKTSGDCTVRVMGDKVLFESLNKQHVERVAEIMIYCKSADSSGGMKRLTALQDIISSFDPDEGLDICGESAYISEVTASGPGEDNSSGEWIYSMTVSIKYMY